MRGIVEVARRSRPSEPPSATVQPLPLYSDRLMVSSAVAPWVDCAPVIASQVGMLVKMPPANVPAERGSRVQVAELATASSGLGAGGSCGAGGVGGVWTAAAVRCCTITRCPTAGSSSGSS